MGIHGLAEYLQLIERGVFKAPPPSKLAMLKCLFNVELHVLFPAVRRGDLEVVRFLLDVGISPNHQDSFERLRLLALAVKDGDLSMAKLIRAYGAQLVSDYEDEPSDGAPSTGLLEWAKDPHVREWLLTRPPSDRDRMRDPRRHTLDGLDAMSAKIVHAWRLALERIRPWSKVRELVRARPIALFWQRVTQERVWTPNGLAQRVVDARAAGDEAASLRAHAELINQYFNEYRRRAPRGGRQARRAWARRAAKRVDEMLSTTTA